MARQHPDDVQKEVDQLEEEVYGDQTVFGTNPAPSSDDNAEENLEAVIGNKPKPGFNIRDEIIEDDEARAEKPINNYLAEPEDEEEPGINPELEEVEEKDPMDELTDEDFAD